MSFSIIIIILKKDVEIDVILKKKVENIGH